MKRILSPILAFACVFLAIATAASANAADSTTIRATLILGTNDGGGVDGSLKAYEKHLKRVLRLDTFKQQGSGSASISIPGTSKVSLGGGNTVNLDVKEASDGKLRIAARWTKGNQTYVNTTVETAPNQPTVLVAPSSGDGKLILLLVAK